MKRGALRGVQLATAAALALWSCEDGSNVGPDRPVATVSVTPGSATTAPGGTVQLQAVTRDAAGSALTDRGITWSSSGDAVATVSATGLVTGVADGSTTITATSEGKGGSAVVTVATSTTLTFASIAARDHTTCAVSTAGAAYCWGLGITGELGDGATAESRRSIPTLVRGGLTFASLSHGNFNSCGIMVGGRAYCWGWNLEAELGVGSTTGPETCPLSTGYLAPCATVPVAVTGDLSFTSLSVGGSHSCGITAAGAAHCWGHNYYGQLGLGSTTGPETCPRSDIPDIVPCSTIPVPVTGGLNFTSVSGGETRTCGVTTGGAAYCWGSGTLGDGSTAFTAHPTPVLVAGSLSFASISASTSHTCGITTAGAAYCWGDNLLGELGDGSGRSQAIPVPVAGGLSFVSISAGAHYTCGVTAAGSAHCWGHGEQGQLGRGDTNTEFTPVPVAGGLSFSAVSAGSTHTCGITTSGIAYCWGTSEYGAIGDGTTTPRFTPVKVAGG